MPPDSSRLASFFADWGKLVAILVAGVTLWLGLTRPAVGGWEARALCVGGPLFAAGWAAARAFDRPVPRRWPVALVLAAAVLLGELAVAAVLWPPAPHGTGDVVAEPARIEVPAEATRFRLTVHGALHEDTGTAGYELELSRGEARDWVRGTVSRQVRSERGLGGRVPTERLEIDERDQHEVALRGAGPVTISRTGEGERLARLEVALAPPRREPVAGWMLVLLVAAAVSTQGWLARRGQRAPLTPAAGAIAVLAAGIGAWNPDAPLTFVAGLGLVAGLGGGLGGWVLGGLVAALVRPRAPS